MAYLNANDVINATEGTVLVNVDGNVREAAEVSTITCSVNFDKSDIKTISTRVIQKKMNTWSGTGTMSVYFSTSFWAEMIIDFINTGKVPEFSLTGVIDDPQTVLGGMRVRLNHCKLDGGDLFKLSTSDDNLTADYNFTFEGAEIVNSFGQFRTLS